MMEVGLEEVETYVLRRQHSVAQYIVTITILELCLAEELRTGVRVNRRCWEQDGLKFGQ